MTGDSGGSERRKYSYVVAPSMRDVLRQPLPPKSVFLWLEEGLRNPQDERIFLLCCMYFLQMRAIRRMTNDSVVEATTWTKTTSRVSSDDSRVSYEETKIISVQQANAAPRTIVAYNAGEKVKQLPQGQQFWERLAKGDCEAPRKEVDCYPPPDYDRIERRGGEDSDDSECYQTMSGKKMAGGNGKLGKLRRSLVKLFKKDSDKLSRTFSNKNVDDLLSVKNCRLRSRDQSVGKHTISVRQYSNLLNVEPRLSFNYLNWLDEHARRDTEGVIYKNDKFNPYDLSDVNVVRSRTVVSVIQQRDKQTDQRRNSREDDDDMDSDVREALAAFEDAYLSDPGPKPSNFMMKGTTTELKPSRDVWKTLATSSMARPYPRFRDIPSPPSLHWQPPEFHVRLTK